MSRRWECTKCGEGLQRTRRSLWERLMFRAAYRCKNCGRMERRNRFSIHVSLYAECPRCGGEELRVFRKVDKIEGMHRGVWSGLSRVLGGRLCYCWFCRLQFYDLRRIRVEAPR